MGLDFYTHIDTARTVKEIVEDLGIAFKARTGQANQLLLPGLSLRISRCDSQTLGAIEAESRVRPSIVIGARLIANGDDLGNDPLLIAILDYLLHVEKGDLVFDFNGAPPELRRLKGDTVIYRERADRSLLDAEHRALLTVPYRLEERFPG